MCKKYMWLKYHPMKLDVGGDIIKYILTNENCLIWQTSLSEKFAVLCDIGTTMQNNH